MAYLTECIKGGSEDKRTGWLIKFGYDRDIVESLKLSVPHTEREWRDDSKIWWISEDYTDILKRLFSNFEALVYLQGKLL